MQGSGFLPNAYSGGAPCGYATKGIKLFEVSRHRYEQASTLGEQISSDRKEEGLWVGATKVRNASAATGPLSDVLCAKAMARFNSCLGTVRSVMVQAGSAPETANIGSRGKCNRLKIDAETHYLGYSDK
jgi:hypothetical protein